MPSNRSNRPTMLFDGDCGFCRRWIKKWENLTRGAVAYHPYQESVSLFPQVSEKQCQRSVQLILPQGKVYSGAHAVFKALELGGKYSCLLWFYEHFPPVKWISESLYQLVARHRRFWSRVLK